MYGCVKICCNTYLLLQGIIGTCLSVLVCLSRLNCYKPTFECLVYPDPHVSICCFSARHGTGRHQLEAETAASIIASSTLVAPRGVTGRYSIAGEPIENARTVHAACKVEYRPSVELTAVDVLVVFYKNIRCLTQIPTA